MNGNIMKRRAASEETHHLPVKILVVVSKFQRKDSEFG